MSSPFNRQDRQGIQRRELLANVEWSNSRRASRAVQHSKGSVQYSITQCSMRQFNCCTFVSVYGAHELQRTCQSVHHAAARDEPQCAPKDTIPRGLHYFRSTNGKRGLFGHICPLGQSDRAISTRVQRLWKNRRCGRMYHKCGILRLFGHGTIEKRGKEAGAATGKEGTRWTLGVVPTSTTLAWRAIRQRP